MRARMSERIAGDGVDLMKDYKDRIGTHSMFDDDRHWRFARKAEPPWYPERGVPPDAVLMIVALFIAVLTLFGVWWSEGGL